MMMLLLLLLLLVCTAHLGKRRRPTAAHRFRAPLHLMRWLLLMLLVHCWRVRMLLLLLLLVVHAASGRAGVARHPHAHAEAAPHCVDVVEVGKDIAHLRLVDLPQV